MNIEYNKVSIIIDDIDEYEELPDNIKTRLKLIHNHNTAINNNINKLKEELKKLHNT